MVPVRPFSYSGRGASLSCGAFSLETLAAKHGTPLYVYSGDHIRYRLSLFARTFAGQPHLVCYAVKANSALAILKLLDREGAGFDIVSGGELERVLAVNKAATARVVFSGVGKTAPEMDLALGAGIVLFNVESEGELALLAERAARVKRRARIALRVNPDVFAETHPYISTGLREHKFGIEFARARSVYRRAAKEKWIEAAGISVHIGSQIRSAEPFGAAVARVASLAVELRKDGLPIRFLDAGGGLGIEYHADQSFHPEEKIAQYASALKQAVRGLDGLQLLLEPGRFLVAQAGALVARVLYVKKNGDKTFVITDAGMNDLIRPALYQAYHEIVPAARVRGRKKMVADIVGPVCETGDFFARDRELPRVAPGELVAILDTGAYGLSLSSNYNSRPRPAEVLIDGGRAKLIRRRETMQELLAAEKY